MRTFIFTDRKRRLLERWLTMGEEAEDMPRIFPLIRRNTSRLEAEKILRVLEERRRSDLEHPKG
jgi:hypothetical protein